MRQTEARARPLVYSTDRGLYCARGDFYIDPPTPVPLALITHAHSDHAREGNSRYLTSRESTGLLRRRVGVGANIQGLEYGERLVLGEVEVSFHPAGHILGSAQIRIASENEVWVVSGDYKRERDPSCAPFEVVPCDTFITEATFGLPIYKWESGAVVAGQIYEWWEKNREAGRASVLFCYALGKSQRVLAELTGYTDRTVFTHRAVESLVEYYRECGVRMLPTRRVLETENRREFAGELILAPPSALTAPWLRRFGEHETGFASGWMRIRGNRRRRGYNRGFSLSDHADWPGLLKTIRETGARKVYVTHGYTEILSRYLAERGLDAMTLGATYRSGEER